MCVCAAARLVWQGDQLALTRLDCDFYRPAGGLRDFSSYVAFDPDAAPGCLVAAGAAAARAGMGSQIACRLALDRFTEGVLSLDPAANAQMMLQTGFRCANRGVYDYSHKMAAAGRMVASLLGLVVSGGVAAAARVGGWSAYLARGRRLFPFFEQLDRQMSPRVRDSLIGAQSLITVETASCPVEGGDRLFLFSACLSAEQEIALAEDCSAAQERGCRAFVEELFFEGEEPALSMIAWIGPEALYLERRIEQY